MRNRPHHLRQSARRAFLLLEVTVAGAVFVIAVVGLVLALNRLLDIQRESRIEEQVRLELESRLAQTRIEQLQIGTTDLDPDPLGNRHTRVVEETEFVNEDEAPVAGILKVTLRALPPKDDDPLDEASPYVYPTGS